MRMHGVGLRLCQVQLTHLLPHIPRHELDGRLHFGHHTLRFLDAIQARLTESFLLGDGADRVDLGLDITGNQLPVATDASLQVDEMVRMADGRMPLANLLSRLREALTLLASRFHRLLGLLQTRGTLGDGRGRAVQVGGCRSGSALHPVERLFSRRHGLVGGTLFGGQGAATALLSSCCTWKRSGE